MVATLRESYALAGAVSAARLAAIAVAGPWLGEHAAAGVILGLMAGASIGGWVVEAAGATSATPPRPWLRRSPCWSR
ncbi:hypothetical protein [Actinoplanes italicus]|uniref:hypothetical protein n=1 Tax=Actinoplanes italicus TaxID=113567 RepID=UPI001EF33035|nr:hypothetical protein [Actinoplanes italicus]